MLKGQGGQPVFYTTTPQILSIGRSCSVFKEWHASKFLKSFDTRLSLLLMARWGFFISAHRSKTKPDKICENWNHATSLEGRLDLPEWTGTLVSRWSLFLQASCNRDGKKMGYWSIPIRILKWSSNGHPSLPLFSVKLSWCSGACHKRNFQKAK